MEIPGEGQHQFTVFYHTQTSMDSYFAGDTSHRSATIYKTHRHQARARTRPPFYIRQTQQPCAPLYFTGEHQTSLRGARPQCSNVVGRRQTNPFRGAASATSTDGCCLLIRQPVRDGPRNQRPRRSTLGAVPATSDAGPWTPRTVIWEGGDCGWLARRPGGVGLAGGDGVAGLLLATWGAAPRKGWC